MRVLLLGGSGGMAHSIIRDFLDFDGEELTRLVIADVRFDRLKAIAEGLDSPKVTALHLDCRDYTKLVEAMKDCDIVVNATADVGDVPIQVLRAALEAGVHVIDLGASGAMTRECMGLSGEFEAKGISGILGLGSSPGIMNLIAKAVADKMDTVDEMNLYFAYASLGTSTLPFKVPFFGALQEFSHGPEVFMDGQITILDPISGVEDIAYPEPIGIRRSFYIPHPEVTTLPMILEEKGLSRLGIKAGFTPEFFEKSSFLASLGLLAGEHLRVGNQEVVPMEVIQACVDQLPPDEGDIKDYGVSRVVATGTKDGVKMKTTATMMCYPFQGMTSAQHRTGHAPAIGARLLHKGLITLRGAYPPEFGVDTGIFFKELARRELEVEVSSTSYL